MTSLLATALLPKCPLCVGALLSAVGLGATVSSTVAPFVRPIVFSVTLLAALNLLWTIRQLHRKREQRIERRQPSCCG